MNACLKRLLEKLRNGKAFIVNFVDLVDSLRFSLRESIEVFEEVGLFTAWRGAWSLMIKTNRLRCEHPAKRAGYSIGVINASQR